MIKMILFFCLSVNLWSQYSWPITRVIDGDTVELQVSWLPRELGTKILLRVEGVDTPEKGFRAKCSQENHLAQQATAFTKQQVINAKTRVIVIHKWDKYGGRILGDLLLNGRKLSDMLIEQKLARAYHGERKSSWCELTTP